MELMVGLSIVDQLDSGRQTRRMAAGWMDRSAEPGRRGRATLAAALMALAKRVAPALPRADSNYPCLADATES